MSHVCMDRAFEKNVELWVDTMLHYKIHILNSQPSDLNKIKDSSWYIFVIF